MKVMIGAPVRNRAWILQRYIDAIRKQDIDFETCFIVNDSQDHSEQILRNNEFNVIVYDLGKFKTETHKRGTLGYSFANLAECRNVLLEEFLKSDCSYLVSIDTDIIIPENSVKRLIESKLDIVSMLIKNSPTIEAYNIMIRIANTISQYQHVRVVGNGYVNVDVTGAVYAISRRVIESGVRYGYHPQGEDIFFCERARENGFKIYCDTRLRPIHCYSEDGGDELVVN